MPHKPSSWTYTQGELSFKRYSVDFFFFLIAEELCNLDATIKCFWKFNNSLLEDDNYVNTLCKNIDLNKIKVWKRWQEGFEIGYYNNGHRMFHSKICQDESKNTKKGRTDTPK